MHYTDAIASSCAAVVHLMFCGPLAVVPCVTADAGEVEYVLHLRVARAVLRVVSDHVVPLLIFHLYVGWLVG